MISHLVNNLCLGGNESVGVGCKGSHLDLFSLFLVDDCIFY